MVMKNFIYAILFSIFLISCVSSPEKKPKILKYTISEQQDISFLNTPKMVYRIILNVDSIPSEIDMKNTAISIWENGNKDWEEFTTFFYLPEMDTDMMAYGVGEFTPNGLVKFEKNEAALYENNKEIKKTKKVEEQLPVAELREYFIDLSSENLNAKEIKIKIKTNFPDGTNLLVNVYRIHFMKGSNEAYSGDIFEKDIRVNQGIIETVVKVDDSNWYNEHQSLVRALPNDFFPISKISDNITVSVLFTPKRKQTENVLKILGVNGEYISGKGAEKKHSFTTFYVSKDIKFPFQK